MRRPERLPHELKVTLQQRARAMRNALTPAEQKFWYHLRRDQIDGLRFRRQHRIGPYITDFFCAELGLAVEVDGDSHTDPEQIAHDAERSRYLAEHRVRVLRFTNVEIHTNLDGVLIELRRVVAALQDRAPSPPPSPPSTGKRE